MLATHPEEGKDLSFKGSMLVYMAENLEEVHQLINGDIYAKSGVWDLGKALVVPVSNLLPFFWLWYCEPGYADNGCVQYLSAVREPLKKE